MRSLILTIILVVVLCLDMVAQNNHPLYTGQTIWDLPELADENINVGLWSLIVAKEFDPDLDIVHYLHRLDYKAEEIKRMLAGRTRNMDKFLAIRTFIYEPGSWNDFSPFQYDLEDPLGETTQSRFLSAYMDSRLGNCITMPLFMAALMERVDPELEFHAVLVPLHMFIRFYDRQSGDVWNVETTNGANPARNSWYIEQAEIQQESIDSGLYLRDLSHNEFLAELIGTLARYHRLNKNYELALSYAELMLELNTKSAVGIVQKAAILSSMEYDIMKQAQANGGVFTEEEWNKVLEYRNISSQYIQKVFAMGWHPESPEQREAYLEEIERERNTRSN